MRRPTMHRAITRRDPTSAMLPTTAATATMAHVEPTWAITTAVAIGDLLVAGGVYGTAKNRAVFLPNAITPRNPCRLLRQSGHASASETSSVLFLGEQRT